MGVIKRFAIWSMVLGTLAMAGGASALAFDGGGQQPAVQPADEPATSDVQSDVQSDVPSDVPSDLLPDTGGPSGAWSWVAPHNLGGVGD